MPPITDQLIDQTYLDLRSTYGGAREDYFGLLYLEKEFNLPREQAAVQNAFGGNDYGVDGFHIDGQRRNLYLFQFKWSASHELFKQSLKRLCDDGMKEIFGDSSFDKDKNSMLFQLRSRLYENQAVIDRVLFNFVFRGDPKEAERSQLLDKLREDLEGKKFLIDQYFKRPVEMSTQFRNALRVGARESKRVTHVYTIEMKDPLRRTGPSGEAMRIGFIRLADLDAMYRDMGLHFFERNIRGAYDEQVGPNRAISRALKQIVLDEITDPSVFAFNHNGVTISCQRVEETGSQIHVTEPQLLNGAQTVATFNRFLRNNEGNPSLKRRENALNQLHVLCKIISDAKPEFVTGITINNNRQNPVMPWNLRANDEIQLDLQDFFHEELRIYYERQENVFDNLTRQDLEELDVGEEKAIELVRLAKTFLASDGDIDKISRMTEVFENDRIYSKVFDQRRLRADARKIILCYKVQFRLRRLIASIIEKGERKYAYMKRARNLLWALLCQAILNDERVEMNADSYGRGLVVEAGFTDYLARLSSRRARLLIRDAVGEEPYATMLADQRYEFLRTRAIYDKCMKLAYRKWKWVSKRL